MQLPPMQPTHLLDKFLRGLKPKTRMELELKDSQTLADRFDSVAYRKTVSLAPSTSHSYEYENNGEPMQIDAMRTTVPLIPWTPTLKKLTTEGPTHLHSIVAGFRCGKTGHVSRECPSKAVSGSSKNSNHQ
jgi:hypothetical protein